MNLDADKIHTLVFSSKKQQDIEHFYYDALLSLRKKYPNKLNSISVIQKDDVDLVKHYQIDTFPTIIVLNGQKEMVRVTGERNVDTIQKELEAAYSN